AYVTGATYLVDGGASLVRRDGCTLSDRALGRLTRAARRAHYHTVSHAEGRGAARLSRPASGPGAPARGPDRDALARDRTCGRTAAAQPRPRLAANAKDPAVAP